MDAVDRVLLLHPSVSTGYDIRDTLGAKEGVDVFVNKKDWVAARLCLSGLSAPRTNFVRLRAGRFGFKPKHKNSLADLEAALRQHHWSQDVAWTGNTGGHHGVHAPAFVQTFLMPLMAGK